MKQLLTLATAKDFVPGDSVRCNSAGNTNSVPSYSGTVVCVHPKQKWVCIKRGRASGSGCKGAWKVRYGSAIPVNLWFEVVDAKAKPISKKLKPGSKAKLGDTLTALHADLASFKKELNNV